MITQENMYRELLIKVQPFVGNLSEEQAKDLIFELTDGREAKLHGNVLLCNNEPIHFNDVCGARWPVKVEKKVFKAKTKDED